MITHTTTRSAAKICLKLGVGGGTFITVNAEKDGELAILILN